MLFVLVTEGSLEIVDKILQGENITYLIYYKRIIVGNAGIINRSTLNNC